MITKEEYCIYESDLVLWARINALYKAYGQSVGIDFYHQTIDGKVTAYIGGKEGSLTLIAFENADFDELNSFFELQRATVFCDIKDAKLLRPKNKQEAELLKFDGAVDSLSVDGHGGVAAVYDVLRKGEGVDIRLPKFEFWYADLCVRVNHYAAEYVLYENAAAVCGFMTEKTSLITGVAVASDQRRKGLGSKVLMQCIKNIKSRYFSSEIFVSTVGATKFYIKNGFKKCGRVAVCEF